MSDRACALNGGRASAVSSFWVRHVAERTLSFFGRARPCYEQCQDE